MKSVYSKQGTTVAKAIYMLLVLANHVVLEFQHHTMLTTFTHNICHVGMFGFLFLSGYGLSVSNSNNGLEKYWEKKIEKIYIPAMLAVTACILFRKILFGVEYNRYEVFNEIFLFPEYPKTIGIFWFLKILFIWYLIFFLVSKFIKRGKRYIVSWIIILLLMWYVMPEIYGLSNTYGWAFPMGVLWAEITGVDVQKSISLLKKIFPFLLVLSVLGLWVIICYGSEFDNSIFGIKMNFFIFTAVTNAVFMSCCLVICYLSEMVGIVRKSRLLNIFGEQSLFIYLLQEPLIVRPMKMCPNNVLKTLTVIVGMILVLVIAKAYSYINTKIRVD